MDPSLVVVGSTGGDYRSTADAAETIPFAVNLDDARSEIGGEILETEVPVGTASVRRPVFSGRLFSLKNNKTKSRVVGTMISGRMFDYKEKYQADEWGAEMADESRFCKMYMDESEIFDLERIESWRDALDVLLVFIGLFSAIVTTFVVQASLALQPDYGQITAALVYDLVLIQRAVAVNGTIAPLPFPEDPSQLSVNPSQIDKWVNGLWFTSLTISLSTALVTVLTKQWLYAYTSQTSGTSKDRARLRQFRFAGLEKYRVPMIIDLLPVALHLSLALFLVGLAMFLSPLDRGMSAVVAIISGLAYASYLGSAILPVFNAECPYRSPISRYLFPIKVPVLRWLYRAQRYAISCAIWTIKSWNSVQARIWQQRVTRDTTHSWEPFLARLNEYRHAVIALPGDSPLSLQAQERQVVLHQCHRLDIDAITWLHSTSSNSTVKDISFQAVVGLKPSDFDTSRLREAIQSRGRVDMLTDHGEILRRKYISACAQGSSMDLADILELERDGIYAEGVEPIRACVHRQAVMSDYMSPGSHSHCKLPLSVWRLCVPHIGEGPLHPILLTRLLSASIPSSEDSERADSEYRTTFIDALRRNNYLRSLVLDILAGKLNIPRSEARALDSLTLLIAILEWALPQLEELRLTVNSSLPWPEDVTLSLLASCLDKYDPAYSTSSLQNRQLRDGCASLLKHDAVYKSTEVSWRVYLSAARALYRIYSFSRYRLYCPPDLIETLIGHLHRTPPPGISDFDINESLEAIPCIVGAGAVDLELLHNLLREADALPLSLAQSGGDGTYCARFWGYEMCRRAVFAGRYNILDVDTSADWVRAWVSYISAPERLLFLFRRLLAWPHLPVIAKRVSPLLDLTSTSPQWVTCFQSLINLLHDDQYIQSVKRCKSPRHELSNILCGMQIPGRFSADLSTSIVPLYDKNDKPISPVLGGDVNGNNLNPVGNIAEDWHLSQAVASASNEDQPVCKEGR